MKTPLILCGLLALSACAATPEPKHGPRTTVIRYDDAQSQTSICFPTARLAASAMRMRQVGIPYHEAVAIGHDNPDLSANVIAVSMSQISAAYQYPIMPTAAQKESVIRKFSADVLNACLYG
jgi:hypothetical protein